MSDTPSSDDIMKAVHQSGYLMEQNVATKLETMGYRVKTNSPYEDTDEGKSREIDILAVDRFFYDESLKIMGFIEMIVECKNSSNPFVFITRPKNEFDSLADPTHFTFPFRYKIEKKIKPNHVEISERSAFFHLRYDKIHYNNRLQSKAVQFCRIDRKGNSWHANHGGLYDAMFYPMAKAVTARKAEISRHSGEWKHFWFLIPVVVTTADLLVIDSTSPVPTLEARNNIGFTRELKSGKLLGRYTLDFVRMDQLETFVEDCIDPLKKWTIDLVRNQTDHLLKTTIPWSE